MGQGGEGRGEEHSEGMGTCATRVVRKGAWDIAAFLSFPSHAWLGGEGDSAAVQHILTASLQPRG